MPTLSSQPSLDHERLWNEMRGLLDRVVSVVDRDTFLDDVLDTLVELFGADRGLILLSDSAGGTCTVSGRNKKGALTAREQQEISQTIIRRVADTGVSLLWEPEIELAGAESITTLGIVSALAAPLSSIGAGGRDRPFTRGVIYLDFRDFEKLVGAEHKEFLEAAALLVSVVIEQGQALLTTREHLREEIAKSGGHEGLPDLAELLEPRSMSLLRSEVATCLAGDSPILVQGESGTGKTSLAVGVAHASGRTPVVRATLGASDDLNTITSELFGHERGAFSSAVTKRVGLVEFADQGTLILDEILNLPPHAQQLLLDFTQFGTYRPLGYDRPEPKRANVRIVAATNGDIRAAVEQGTFREDLYYRIAGATLYMPPLRERREDAPGIAEAFLRRLDPDRSWKLTVDVRRLLVSDAIDWPGNVRQLESVVRRARDRAVARDVAATQIAIDCFMPRDFGVESFAALGAPVVTVAPPRAPTAEGPASTRPVTMPGIGEQWSVILEARDSLDRRERQLIVEALDAHDGVVAHVARELGVARTSLVSRMSTLGIHAQKKR